MIFKKIKALVCRVVKRGTLLANKMLNHLETRPISGKDAFDFPPIFIIGPPRSGSTLLFQVMVNAFNFGYTSNAHAKWYGGMSYYERFRSKKSQGASDYTSQHGRTKGKHSPHESWQYWYQFFRKTPMFVGNSDIAPSLPGKLRRSLLRITRASEMPFLFKNLPCAMRLAPLTNVVPEALYIVTQRDYLATAHSILAGRKKANGNYDDWWSVEPKEIDELRKLPAEEQVVKQIYSIYHEIDSHREKIGPDKILDISYEVLCEDTHGTIERIQSFLESNSINTKAGYSEVPFRFDINKKVKIDADLYTRLETYVQMTSKTLID